MKGKLQFIVRVGEQTFEQFPVANRPMDDAANAAEFFRETVATREDFDPMREHLVVATLNTKLVPTGYHIVAIGTLTECTAHPREILRPCIVSAAYGFVLFHNHPSGDPSPSQSDRRLTQMLFEACKLMEIRLVDHIIIGSPAPDRSSYFSFKEAGIV